MLDWLIRALSAPEPPALDRDGARLALAGLLVRAARADDDYATHEAALIDAILAETFALPPAEARALRAAGEKLEASAPDTVRFTRAIKAAVPLEERSAILTALWRVILADGTRAEGENALMRLSANLLGLTDRQNAEARHRAEGH